VQRWLVTGTAQLIHQNPTECAPPEEKPPDPQSPPRVLVAEDDPELRRIMVQLLAFEGYFVTEASNGYGLLNAVKACRDFCDDTFDLIVTDVRMPGLTGLEALARLRQSGCDAPAIVVSALPRDLIQDQMQELGAIFIAKPFALDSLRKVANQAIYRQQS
jgi:two-component system response regulator MprA